ncbi:hypothetical protein SRHO_G00154620 [Serrasalmus rhombeus]
MRVELLSDIKKRNNRETIRAKMEKMFTLRRQEVICDASDAPMVSDVQERWPALFDVIEDDVEAGRECIIKGLYMYLNEDPKDLVQEEYMIFSTATRQVFSVPPHRLSQFCRAEGEEMYTILVQVLSCNFYTV